MSFSLGKKLGMTRFFDESGNHAPATLIQIGPCWITQVKSKSTDGYNAVQIGFGLTRTKSLNKPRLAHLKKAGVESLRHLREFRVDDPAAFKQGEILSPDRFKAGQRVTISGISKGRGFAGVIKRHGFASPNATHGTHEYHRHPGAVGAHTDPGRLWKGQRLPGHMGNQRVTVKDLAIMKIDVEQNLMLVQGAVPGARNGLVEITLSHQASR
ncbi:MAG TPA: 50S ribosomal protein L3 [bacterium]|jgi:large subunit ribosomal protein L3